MAPGGGFGLGFLDLGLALFSLVFYSTVLAASAGVAWLVCSCRMGGLNR